MRKLVLGLIAELGSRLGADGRTSTSPSPRAFGRAAWPRLANSRLRLLSLLRHRVLVRRCSRSPGTTLIARTGTAMTGTRTAHQSAAQESRMARDMAIPSATPTTDTGCPGKAPSGRSVKPIARRPRSGRQDQPLGGEIEEVSPPYCSGNDGGKLCRC